MAQANPKFVSKVLCGKSIFFSPTKGRNPPACAEIKQEPGSGRALCMLQQHYLEQERVASSPGLPHQEQRGRVGGRKKKSMNTSTSSLLNLALSVSADKS